MKHLRKVITLVIAALCALAVATPAWAADGKITVTPPENTESTSKNTYKLYKVFDAVTDGNGHFSYKLTSHQTDVPSGFVKDDAGNVYMGAVVTEEGTDTFKVMIGGQEKIIKPVTATSLTDAQIQVIAGYVNEADLVDTKEVTGRTPAEFTGLEPGYYYVSTTTGTLVVIDSITPDVSITDKNEVPTLDKKITDSDAAGDSGSIVDETGKQAIAQVGKSVEYTLTVTKKKGAENYIVKDELGTGLKYNKDAKVYIGTTEVSASTGEGASLVTNFTKTTETDSNLVITFDNAYISGLDDDTVLTVKYTALVTEDALHTTPAKNSAWLEYGHTPGENSTPKKETETYNAKFSVTKQDGDGAALAGAGFILKDKTSGKYYQYTAATSTAPETIAWVDEAQATVYTSQSGNGELDGEFTGLPNGTYILIEKNVPAGYNKAADYEFEVKEKDVTPANLVQSTTVVNNQGSELPSTGGMGTTVLYTVGGILIAAGGIWLVTKKRLSAME